MYVVDSFIPSFDSLRAHADSVDYQGVRNPVDGVVYPGISTDIPASVKEEVICATSTILSTAISPNAIFTRLSLADVPVPHQAHTDSTMGQWSLMLYLNRPEHCKGGTSLVRHRTTGMLSDPRGAAELAIWKTDTNKPEAWEIVQLVPMRPNRAFLFPSHRMHRAEPIGGFGDSPKNGRLVLTMFFNLGENTFDS
jgi:hypothetical protein